MLKHANLIIIAILLSAFSLKTIRYSSATPNQHDQSIERKLSSLMTHHGWHIPETPQKSGHALFKTLTYSSPSCAHSISVAVLGDNRELYNFVKSALGDDLAILENNQFTNSWSPQNRGLRKAATATLLRAPQFAPIPPLAISPAPTKIDDACDTPKIENWLIWSKNWR